MRKCKVFVHGTEAGVSLLLPPREAEYRSDVLFPYFFNLLSEGENRAGYHHRQSMLRTE